MIVLHDGAGQFLEIEMADKNGISFEGDFFEAGKLEKVKIDLDCIREDLRKKWESLNIFYVHDVDYCLDQAEDCKNGVGDFDGMGEDIEITAKIYQFNNAVI